MKTYAELEQIGIVGMYNDDHLHVIIKGGEVWKYMPTHKVFYYIHNL